MLRHKKSGRFAAGTATCAPAYRWRWGAEILKAAVRGRHRSVAERNNDCGAPVVGLEEPLKRATAIACAAGRL